jgi:hypothetical protein
MTVAGAAVIAGEVVPESKINSEPAKVAGNETKPITEAEIKEAKSEAAWAKFNAKKAAYAVYL